MGRVYSLRRGKDFHRVPLPAPQLPNWIALASRTVGKRYASWTPEHAEVANAVGAIVGRIVETVEIDIHPVYSVAGIDRYEVRSPVQVRTFRDRKLALRYAVEHGEQLVIDKAKRAGAEQVEAKIEHQHREAPTEDGQPIYLGTRIQAVGSGNQPKVAPSDKS